MAVQMSKMRDKRQLMRVFNLETLYVTNVEIRPSFVKGSLPPRLLDRFDLEIVAKPMRNDIMPPKQ